MFIYLFIPGQKLWDPRTVFYPMEIADVMDAVKAGRQNTLPAKVEQVGADVAGSYAALARNIEIKLFSYEGAPKLDSNVARWISIARNAALSSHAYILEDGPEPPKVP
jgi:hypothetical protein